MDEQKKWLNRTLFALWQFRSNEKVELFFIASTLMFLYARANARWSERAMYFISRRVEKYGTSYFCENAHELYNAAFAVALEVIQWRSRRVCLSNLIAVGWGGGRGGGGGSQFGRVEVPPGTICCYFLLPLFFNPTQIIALWLRTLFPTAQFSFKSRFQNYATFRWIHSRNKI